MIKIIQHFLLTITATAILTLIFPASLFAMGGTDGAKSGSGDQLTGDILADKYHVDPQDVPPPNHDQINQSSIQENKAKQKCLKLKGVKRQKCLDNLP